MAETKYPTKLYKYQPFTTWSISNLKNRSIWFSKPSKFNDPFDCTLGAELVEYDEKGLEQLYQKFKNASPNSETMDAKYLTDGVPNELFREEAVVTTRGIFDAQKEEMLNDHGVAAFAEEVNNLLMWSHYGDGHRGFCLEYDTEYKPFSIHSKAFQVHYSDEIPTLNPVELLDPNKRGPFMSMIRTKSSEWSYEKEWRLFHMEGDKEYFVDPNALTGVYFGCAMPFDYKEIIALILKDTRTSLYEMKKVDRKYGVVSHPVDYKPFDFNE